MENLDNLKGYLDENGKFSQFPGKKQKIKQRMMLEILATKFEGGKEYTEMEVNDILNEYHTFNDPASLRRMMFGSGLLDRTIDCRKYWKK